MSTAHVDPFEFGPMSKAVPIGGLATQKERQTTDAVVREIIRQQDGDFDVPIELACAKSRADACIAATDDQQSHVGPIAFRYCRFLFAGRRYPALPKAGR